MPSRLHPGGRQRLRGAIISGLDWMDANYYNETKTEYDNWFDWEIGVSLNLNDITVLLYDNLTGGRSPITRMRQPLHTGLRT